MGLATWMSKSSVVAGATERGDIGGEAEGDRVPGDENIEAPLARRWDCGIECHERGEASRGGSVPPPLLWLGPMPVLPLHWLGDI